MTGEPLIKSIRLSTILGGDTRLEASTYLRDGYGFARLANQCPNHTRLGDLADIWLPSRLTGYEVPEGKGLPFLTAGQIFEDFPRVRKWLAAAFVPEKDKRFANPKWLLITRSGVVGRVTAIYPHHQSKVLSDDLLRIVPKDDDEYGWLYAYMRTEFFIQIAQAAQYGHMIKHLEISHAAEFPIIMPDKETRLSIGKTATAAIQMRSRAWELRDESFALLERCMDARRNDSIQPLDSKQSVINLSTIMQNRLRLDADSYSGQINAIVGMVANGESDTIRSLTTFCSDLGRFSRIFGDGGRPYVSASELFDVNAKPTKMIYAKLVKDWEKYILHSGTIIMACSGQKYGILGRALMLTDNHEGLFGSHDLMRIIVDESRIRPGYLLAFLNDPRYGRPYVVRNAYGTSIPHLDSSDIQEVRIPRFEDADEKAIADLMDESVRLSAQADELENKATRLAQEQIDAAIAALSK